MINYKCLFLILLIVCILRAQIDTNSIRKNNFNFGHQSGYMYSRMEDAYFKEKGAWDFQTGFIAYYTSNMPLVQDSYWKKRLMLIIPLYFHIYPCNSIELEFELTDLFVEFPYQNIKNMGGKTPRFKTKMRLLKEKTYLPAAALTLGVTFSSAKPSTIWDHRHNYYQSNGLSGAGTGEADYIILFTLSKTIDYSVTITTRFGLAPLGSPVEYERGSGQADEIPYGISIKKIFSKLLSCKVEVSGMYNGLKSTTLAHYSVARAQVFGNYKKSTFSINLEHGLTRESDEWVAGVFSTFHFGENNKQ